MKNLKVRIREVLREKGITFGEVAELWGCHYTTVSNKLAVKNKKYTISKSELKCLEMHIGEEI